MPLLTEYEDQTRYSAPPDSNLEEPTYLISQILRYVESLGRLPYNYHYTIEEILDLFNDASDNLTDPDIGIDSV